MKEVALKAIEGGYSSYKMPEDVFREYYIDEKVCLDPEFWRCLGMSLGWNGLIPDLLNEEDIGKIMPPNEWEQYWHEFIHHLAEGKDINSFFEALLAKKD